MSDAGVWWECREALLGCGAAPAGPSLLMGIVFDSVGPSWCSSTTRPDPAVSCCSSVSDSKMVFEEPLGYLHGLTLPP